MTGRVLEGRYRVGAKIARGGMATVYEAHDLRLDRGCAVKVMHDDLGEDDDFRRRFVREAHSAARLSHPNVVAVTDQGDDDGALFLVMEHVRGVTLRDVMRAEAPMPPERALALLEPVLAALAEAHANGLVHRDVKPENVLIADDGRVKVADFGLARAFDASVSQTATRGVLIGTVSYLAPELIVDGSADPRVDVYAAGVLLFEMLTGRKPHEGEGAIQIAFKHVNEDVAAPSTRTEQPLPAYVDALVTRATSRERDLRQADAKVFLHQLRRVTGALRAGVLDDDELTADLLPPVPVAVDTDELHLEAPASEPVPRAAAASWGDDPWGGDVSEDFSADLSGELGALGPAAGLEAPDGFEDDAEPVDDVAARADVPLPDAEETTTIFSGGLPRTTTSATAAGAGAAARSSSRRSPGRAAGASRAGSGGVPGQPVPRSRTTAASAPTGGTPSGRAAGTPGTGGTGTITAERPTPGTPGAPAPARARRRRPRRGVVLLVVVALLTALAGYGGWWLAVGRYTSMPGVINLAVPSAKARADAAGLDLAVVSREFSETVPAGSVISTEPAAGSRIVEGGTAEVVVSKGRERYAVPALAGTPLREVESVLAERNLTLGEPVRRWNETVGRGRVVSVDPSVGTELRRDSVVTVVVSRGPRPIDIPDFTGRNAERAQARLDDLGFTVDATEENSDTVDKGTVISQSPDEGTGFREDVIELVVSKGPVLVTVPDLQGMSVEEATSALEAQGLLVDVEETALYIGLDTVVRQSTDGGVAIPKGSTVTVGVV